MSSFDLTPGTARPQGFLVVEAEGAQIDVQDAWMHPVVSGTMDRLERPLPAGAYQVSARIGDAEQSRLVVVRPAATARVVLEVRIDAAAPAYGTATRNETHGMLLGDLTSPGPSWPTLVVMLRGLKGHEMAPLDVPLTVFDARGSPIKVPPPQRDTYTSDHDPRAIGWALELPQGGYRLRWPGPGDRPVEHAVWVSEGWQTIVFVPQGRYGPVPAGASVHLVEGGQQWMSHDRDTLATERALAALREPTVTEIATTFWTDLHRPAAPMLVLLTAHLMVRARAFGVFSADPPGDQLRLAEAVTELRAQLGDNPDVLALAAGLGFPDAASPPSSWPPMLTASLDMLLAADDEAVPLIPPGSTVEAVTGQRFANRPLLLWDPSAGTLSHEEPIEWAGHAAMRGQFANVTPARSTIAVSRVRDLVSAVARRMDTDLADAASRLGTAEIAKRLGMARSLVRDCLTVINADDEGPLSL